MKTTSGFRFQAPISAFRRRFQVSSLIFAFCFLLSVFPICPTWAATHYVDANCASPIPPYTNWATAARVIQDAVDEASDGETVLVTNGLYNTGGRTVGTNLLQNRVAIERAIRLESVKGPPVTIIEGARAPAGDESGNGDGAVRCIYLGLTNAVVSGFTLTNGHTMITDHWPDGFGGGVNIAAHFPGPDGMLTNCMLSGNSAYGGGGAYGGILYNCTLTGNSASSGGGGVSLSTVNNCILTGNSASEDGGGAYGGTLYNCTLTGNSANCGGGVYLGSRQDEALVNSIVYFNRASVGANYFIDPGYPIQIEYSCTTPLPPGPGNIDADPQLASATHLSAYSPCRGAGNPTNALGLDIDGEPWANPPSMGADELASDGAFGPLTMSITASYTNFAVGLCIRFTAHNIGRIKYSVWDFGDGTVVTNQPFATHAWNSLGIYTVKLTGYNDSYPQGITTTLVVQVVALPVHYVNAANKTPAAPYASWATAAANIQDAIDAGTTAGRLVLVTNGVYRTGVVMRSGPNRVALSSPVVVQSVNGPKDTVIDGEQYRCAYVGNDCVLTGFTLTNGWGYAPGGGGIYSDGFGTVSNCVITGNGGGGVYGVTLYDCTLTGNGGGGGSYCTLYNCMVISNSIEAGATWGYGGGGGVSYCTLYNCTVTGNRAYHNRGGLGGGSFNSTLYNCLITSNLADGGWGWGGGLGGGACGGTLYNCTLTGNSAAEGGGGVFGGTLYNCIVYFNTAPNDPNYLQHDWSTRIWSGPISYTCTTPMPTNGVGNITADPRFVNDAAGDYRLLPDSPCIDAGTNLVDLTATDLLGLPRVMDGNNDGIARVDMGAHEFNPYRFEPTPRLTSDGFRFTVHGEPGRSVRIERSRDLVNWEFAGQVPIPASGQTLIDPLATIEPRLFYRAMRVP